VYYYVRMCEYNPIRHESAKLLPRNNFRIFRRLVLENVMCDVKDGYVSKEKRNCRVDEKLKGWEKGRKRMLYEKNKGEEG